MKCSVCSMSDEMLCYRSGCIFWTFSFSRKMERVGEEGLEGPENGEIDKISVSYYVQQ